jgi:hypothetical protein
VTEHGKAQETFDSSLRTLAGAGLGITVSLATALKAMLASGVWAAALFLGSLFLTLGSYVFAQLDMRARMDCLTKNPTSYKGVERSDWTTCTWRTNAGAGATLLACGVLLVLFISRSV